MHHMGSWDCRAVVCAPMEFICGLTMDDLLHKLQSTTALKWQGDWNWELEVMSDHERDLLIRSLQWDWDQRKATLCVFSRLAQEQPGRLPFHLCQEIVLFL